MYHCCYMEIAILFFIHHAGPQLGLAFLGLAINGSTFPCALALGIFPARCREASRAAISSVITKLLPSRLPFGLSQPGSPSPAELIHTACGQPAGKVSGAGDGKGGPTPAGDPLVVAAHV